MYKVVDSPFINSGKAGKLLAKSTKQFFNPILNNSFIQVLQPTYAQQKRTYRHSKLAVYSPLSGLFYTLSTKPTNITNLYKGNK